MNKKPIPITARVPYSLNKLVENECDSKNTTKADIVRIALEERYENQKSIEALEGMEKRITDRTLKIISIALGLTEEQQSQIESLL